MARVTLVSLDSTGLETSRDFDIPGGTEEIEVQSNWLHCYNPRKGKSVYFRLTDRVRRVEVDYD